jgi:hypothetical protein
MLHNEMFIGHEVQPVSGAKTHVPNPEMARAGSAPPDLAEEELSDAPMGDEEQDFIRSTSSTEDPAQQLLNVQEPDPTLHAEDDDAPVQVPGEGNRLVEEGKDGSSDSDDDSDDSSNDGSDEDEDEDEEEDED